MAAGQPLAGSNKPVKLNVLNGARVLLLDDGHCFRAQAWSLCAPVGATEMSFRATSLATLVQMVGSGASVTPSRIHSAPMPLGPWILCAETARRSTLSGMGSRP